jgi:nucleoside-diphosphate-sugar epimerase
MNYSGKRVVVTGGLGFIGSNLALRLVDLGAQVTIIDSAVDGCGANYANIREIGQQVTLIQSDIGEAEAIGPAIAKADVIFNLAGEISHTHSMEFPERDLNLNTVAQLRFVLACAEKAPGVRIVYAGTRQIYGRPVYLPVDEDHPVAPVDFNGVHKYAATQYHMLLARLGRLNAVVLRLSNVYGPRMALNVACQGFLSTFFRHALSAQQLEVFGDGRQLRDPVYVEDVVEAFLLAGGDSARCGQAYNVGGPEALDLLSLARILSELTEGPEPRLRPFPPERLQIDIASYVSDWSRLKNDTGWTPRVTFREGAARTLAFYRDRLSDYLDARKEGALCQMREHRGPRMRLTYSQGG